MDSARILIVEDDPQVADVVLYSLERNGFQVRHADDGRAGLEVFQRFRPDLVVLDLNLPRLSGHEVFHELRRSDPRIPVIMLTCQSEEMDRIVGLEMGADDYVTKPFSARELVGRIRAVLRRCRTPEEPVRIIAKGQVTLDTEAWACTYFGQRVELTRPEFEIMRAFVSQPARTFTRDELIRRMYDGAHAVTDRTVDAAIKRLRRKFEAAHAGEAPIRTVYGLGYRFQQPACAS